MIGLAVGVSIASIVVVAAAVIGGLWLVRRKRTRDAANKAGGGGAGKGVDLPVVNDNGYSPAPALNRRVEEDSLGVSISDTSTSE